MLRDLSNLQKIYIACGRTDLRKGIDGLATLVKEHFQLDPFQKDVLFLFCGTRKDRFSKRLYGRVMVSCFCINAWKSAASSGRMIPANFRKSPRSSSGVCLMALS